MHDQFLYAPTYLLHFWSKSVGLITHVHDFIESNHHYIPVCCAPVLILMMLSVFVMVSPVLLHDLQGPGNHSMMGILWFVVLVLVLSVHHQVADLQVVDVVQCVVQCSIMTTRITWRWRSSRSLTSKSSSSSPRGLIRTWETCSQPK